MGLGEAKTDRGGGGRGEGRAEGCGGGVCRYGGVGWHTDDEGRTRRIVTAAERGQDEEKKHAQSQTGHYYDYR